MSVEIRARRVEWIGGSCGLPFNGGDVCVGHLGTGETFANSAGSQKDGSGRGQNLARRPACKLPPHLSTLLGLSQEQECPVRQGVVRTGKVVQGFDVSTSNKNDVVLFI